ncbi:Hypothetical protein SCF082_LOCUS46301 [Durusdinium trenchii]|uniref:Lipocalin/cytosolic fatty-acid binding domain-containing protein n=1 Tax=Durusdinium trenchii TaxID=1381693 RepID=A0ABP0RHV8_9DINO
MDCKSATNKPHADLGWVFEGQFGRDFDAVAFELEVQSVGRFDGFARNFRLQGDYNGLLNFAYQKRAQVLLCEYWAKLYKVLMLSCHLGWVDNELCNDMYQDSEVLMEPKRDWWSAAEGLLWLCVSRPRNLESGGFYLDKILQPKHLAGPFFTEGEATKNSIAECKALVLHLEEWTVGHRPLMRKGAGEAVAEENGLDLERILGRWYVIWCIGANLEEGETNLVREYGWDATESFILARSLGRRGDRRFISEERLVPLGRSTWCRKPLLGLPSGSCPDYVLLYCAEHVKAVILGTSDGQSLWLMSRQHWLEGEVLQKMRDHLEKSGYDASRLTKVPQEWMAPPGGRVTRRGASRAWTAR